MTLKFLMCIFALQLTEAQYLIPVSNEIYATVGKQYSIGFNPSKSVHLCGSSTDRNFRFRTEVTKLNDIGLNICEIEFKADADGPTSLTVTATEHFGTEKKTQIKIIYCAETEIANRNIVVYEHGYFIQYLKAANSDFKICMLKNLPVGKYWQSNMFDSIKNPFTMTPLTGNICGFKFENVTLPLDMSYTQWSLIAQDANNDYHQADFTLTVMPFKHHQASVIDVDLNQNTHIPCGRDLKQDFCELYNPKGDLMRKGAICNVFITVTLDDLGMWKCIVGQKESIETSQFRIELRKSKKEKVIGWIDDSSADVLKLGCYVKDLLTTSRMSACILTSPTQKKFLVHEYSANERYTALGTNYDSYTCTVTIQKPLQETEEIGLWRCEITVGIDHYATMIGVNNTLNYNKHFVKRVRSGESLFIQCEVPYSSKHCYIKSPNGTIYHKSTFQPEIGMCHLEFLDATQANVNGSWTCFFARRGEADDQIQIEVIIAEVLNYQAVMEVNKQESAKLKCTFEGVSLEYCIFVAPNQTSYSIDTEEPILGISYFGRGLEYGDCGIEIHQVEESDHGNWTCRTNVDNAEIKVVVSPDFIHRVTENDNAMSIGLFIGILIVAVGFLVIRRRRKQVKDNSTLTDNDSNELFNLSHHTGRQYN